MPVVAGYIDKFTEMWATKEIAEIDRKRSDISRERRALMSQISKAKDASERRILSITLSRLNKL